MCVCVRMCARLRLRLCMRVPVCYLYLPSSLTLLSTLLPLLFSPFYFLFFLPFYLFTLYFKKKKPFDQPSNPFAVSDPGPKTTDADDDAAVVTFPSLPLSRTKGKRARHDSQTKLEKEVLLRLVYQSGGPGGTSSLFPVSFLHTPPSPSLLRPVVFPIPPLRTFFSCPFFLLFSLFFFFYFFVFLLFSMFLPYFLFFFCNPLYDVLFHFLTPHLLVLPLLHLLLSSSSPISYQNTIVLLIRSAPRNNVRFLSKGERSGQQTTYHAYPCPLIQQTANYNQRHYRNNVQAERKENRGSDL